MDILLNIIDIIVYIFFFFGNPFELLYSAGIGWWTFDNKLFPKYFLPKFGPPSGEDVLQTDVIFICTLLLC